MKPKIENKHIVLFLPTVVLIAILIVLILSLTSGGVSTSINLYVYFFIILIFLLIVLTLGLTTIYLVLVRISSSKRDILEIEAEEIRKMNDAELSDLLHKLKIKKEKIEYMLKIAKRKYHKREMDEESLREITRDNQKKLIKIELEMKELEDQINTLKIK